jgi:hypothetical protein
MREVKLKRNNSFQMEKEIKEDRRPVKNVLRLIAGILFGVLILCNVILYFQGRTAVHKLLVFNIGMPISFGFIFIAVAGKLLMRPKVTWFATDDGLKYVRASGEQKMILWKQILHMKNTSASLAIRWKETESKSKESFEQREILYLGSKEAEELILLWRHGKTPNMKQI